MFRRTMVMNLLGSALLIVLSGSVAVVRAEPEVAGRQEAGEQHCAVRIDPVQEGQIESVMSEATCFETFAEAITVATGGAVQLSDTATPADFVEPASDASTNQSRTVIGIDYQHINYQGATLVWYSDTGGCTPTRSYSARSMPSGWNDQISSARAYGNCYYSVHYEDIDFYGSLRYCPCSSMGVMNDATSSIRWRYYY